ncbi:MAG: site-specific integrase, partial [Silvibacterium sp.]
MIESIFKRQYTKTLHKNAPFLKEREAYLGHLQTSGRRKQYLQKTATTMLHIIRVLQLTEWRYVDNTEIKNAALKWASEDTWQRNIRGRRTAADRFMHSARRWLRFQNILVMPKESEFWFDSQLAEFRKAIELNGRKPVTCESRLSQVRQFFKWAASKRTTVQAITISDIDDYVDERLRANLSPQSIGSDYYALRLFFSYAEAHGWCACGFSRGLKSPFRRKRTSEGKGPTWRETRRLISSCDRETPSDVRAKAVLLLCSVYGLRNGEVTRLRLNDLDWQNEIITVTRSKSGRVQQFPIQYEVGEAIIAYLRQARPETSCRQLFMTTYPPYRPLRTLWPIISRRMRKLKISSNNVGPHALRHACATELLRKGASLREIADFLGHQNLSSVGIYAKHDLRSLR